MYPDSIIDLSFAKINLYGLFFAIGVVMALVVFLFYARKAKMNENLQNFVYYIGIIAIGVGYFFAVVFQAFYNFLDDGGFGSDAVFSLKNSGITFLGGLIGGVASFCLVFFIFGKKYKKEFWKIVEIAPCSITLAHAFGRFGCLFAGCCHGTETDAWYGITMETHSFGITKVVPTQLYEAIILLAMFALFSWMFFNKKWDINMSCYLIIYGVWRIIIEIFRDDYRGTFVGSLTPSQFWSIVMIVVGVGLLITKYILKKKKNYEFKC